MLQSLLTPIFRLVKNRPLPFIPIRPIVVPACDGVATPSSLHQFGQATPLRPR